jgi:predicted small integral membrane protein
MGSERWKQWGPKLHELAKMIGQMLYGMTVYEMVRDLHKERGMIERLFILAVFGDLLGVPLLPPYYALRLLPHVVPNIQGWRYSMLRERDPTDLCDQEIT